MAGFGIVEWRQQNGGETMAYHGDASKFLPELRRGVGVGA